MGRRWVEGLFWLVGVPVFWIVVVALWTSLPVRATLFSRPAKTGCPSATTYTDAVAAGCTTILATDVDADLNGLTSTINNLDNTNLSPTANIKGTQILANTITSGNIQDGTIVSADLSAAAGIVNTQLLANTITSGRLAVGATLRNFASAAPTLNASISTVETTLITLGPITTTTGGRLVFFNGAVGYVTQSAATADQITFRLKRDGAQIAIWDYFIDETSASLQIPLLLPSAIESLGAGAAHTYTFTVQTASANTTFHTPGLNVGTAYLLELS